jgi:hypothetical protein
LSAFLQLRLIDYIQLAIITGLAHAHVCWQDEYSALAAATLLWLIITFTANFGVK